MKAKIYFTLESEYNTINYKPLINLGECIYNSNLKKYVWKFDIKDIKEVQKIIGLPIEFEKEEFELIKDLTPGSREAISLDLWKGKGETTFKEFPKIYQIWEKRKIETEDGFIIKDVKAAEVNKELIKTIYNGVILKLPLNKKIKTETIIKNISELLDLKISQNHPRILRQTKFYIIYFWSPCKILQHLGHIRHWKKGYIERLTDKPLEFQTEFQEVKE